MQLSYCVTWEDYREAIVYRMKREGKKSFLIVRCFALLYAAGIVLVGLMAFGGPLPARLAAVLGNPVVWGFLIAFLLTDYRILARISCWFTKKRGGVHDRNFTPKRLLLLPECLKVIEEETGAEESFSYSHFTEVCTTRNLILLMISKSLILIIPRRCFESEGQAAQFLDSIDKARQACAAASSEGEAPAPSEGKDGDFKISFDFDEGQFLSLHDEQSRFIRKTMWKRAGFWVLCVLALIPVRMLFFWFESYQAAPYNRSWTVPLIYLFCLLIFVYLFLVFYGRPKWLVRWTIRTAKKQGRIPPGSVGPRTLVIDREGVHTQTGTASILNGWDQIDALYQGQAFWIFLRKQCAVAAVPLSMIEDKQALLETIRRYAPAVQTAG